MDKIKNCPVCDLKTAVENLKCECGYDFICVEEHAEKEATEPKSKTKAKSK